MTNGPLRVPTNDPRNWQHEHKEFYRIYPLKKRHGGVRWIHNPQGELRETQEALNLRLQGREYHPAACAFLPGCSPQGAFARHLGNLREGGWLLTMDIKDFYGHVTGWMLKRQDLTNDEILICCIPHPSREWVLPQGGITSPLAANLAAKPLDEALDIWARRRGLIYTRYADDLGFSGPYDFRALEPRLQIGLIIREHGFEAAPNKTRMQAPGSGQTYLGIVFTTDGNLSVSRKYRNQARAMLHNDRSGRTTNHDVVQGVLQYVKSVNKTQFTKLTQSERGAV